MTRPSTTGNEQWREQRIPLPGLYPVLTWQLNLTVHKATGLAKFVSVIREPNDRVELSRSFAELDEWIWVHQEAREACELAIVDMGLLMSMPTRIHQR